MCSSQSAVKRFSFLRNDSALERELLDHAPLREVPVGVTLFREGDRCERIAFILEGEIRVYKAGPTGREITLYEIGPGDICILNASSILSDLRYPANAVTSDRTEMLLLPAAIFRRMVERHTAMQRFVYRMLSQRLTAMMSLIEEIVFNRVDQRLFDYLLEKSENGVLARTHLAIANDLGTSREVVSRLLKDLHGKGVVRLARSHIEILANRIDGPHS
jgi:CRP/FNR family transcriptional regulator